MSSMFLSRGVLPTHSLAYRIRRHDAEVSFKLDIFLEEFLIQFFGHIAWPCIRWRKGRAGARNRTLDCNPSHGQFTISALMALSICAYWAFRFSGQGFSITATEHGVLMLIFAARAAVVAGKYAHYDRVSYAQLDRAGLSEEDRVAKLVLVGWVTPTPKLVLREMEKAIARSSPHFARLRVVFPSCTERDAVLRSIAVSLPSYCELELGVAPKQPPPPPPQQPPPPSPPTALGEEEGRTRNSCLPRCCCACGRRRQRRLSPAASPAPQPPVASVSLDEAVAVFLAASPPDTLAAAEPDPAGADVYADITESARPVASPALESRGGSAAPLPALPAKVVLWHILRTRYVVQYSHWAYRVSVGLGLVFALLPAALRIAGLTGDAGWASEPCTIVLLVLHAYATLVVAVVVQMFLFVGVLDLARRRRCAEDLEACLDADATLALRTEISDDGCPPAAASARDGEEGEEEEELVAQHGDGLQEDGDDAGHGATASAAATPAGSRSRGGPPVSVALQDSVPGSSARLQRASGVASGAPPGSTTRARGSSTSGKVTAAASQSYQDVAGGTGRRGEPLLRMPPPRRHGSLFDVSVNVEDEDAQLLRFLRGGRRRASSPSGASAAAEPDASSSASFSPALPATAAAAAARRSGMSIPGMCEAPPPSESTGQYPSQPPPDAAPKPRRCSDVDTAVFIAVDGGSLAPPRRRSSVVPVSPAPAVPVATADDDEPGTAAQLLGGRQARADISQRYAGLSADELEAALLPTRGGDGSSRAAGGCCGGGGAPDPRLGPGAAGVMLPLLYPSNLITWGALRHVLHDVGREYAMRISFCCLLFFGLVLLGELSVLAATLFDGWRAPPPLALRGGGGSSAAAGGTPLDFLMLTTLAGFLLVVFVLAIVAQILQGALVNRATAAHQLRLNTIETLVYELLSTAAAPLPRALRLRLLAVHRVAAVINERLKILDTLEPARVMFVPARFALLGAMASVTGSVVLLLLRAFQAVAAMPL